MKLVPHGKSSKPTENMLQYWPKSIDVLKKTLKLAALWYINKRSLK
jgi:hypothetical protein